jgi:hypothetical protein
LGLGYQLLLGFKIRNLAVTVTNNNFSFFVYWRLGTCPELAFRIKIYNPRDVFVSVE